jgi:hypothetical protein
MLDDGKPGLRERVVTSASPASVPAEGLESPRGVAAAAAEVLEVVILEARHGPRQREAEEVPVGRTMGPVAWPRLAATADSPACLALDVADTDVGQVEALFAPGGLLTLELDGARPAERVLLSDGTEVRATAFS